MSAQWGKKLELTIFGESHAPAIGGVISGIPAGTRIDTEYITREMARRAPGGEDFVTPRKERDYPKILCGVLNGYATGAPIAFEIENDNQHPWDYDALGALARPGHADYTGFVKFGKFGDRRGGGRFSGRITAGLVFAGAVSDLVLSQKGIYTAAHIKSIAEVEDDFFPEFVDERLAGELKKTRLPVLKSEAGKAMRARILAAKDEGDSVGGVIECAIMNLPAGVGEPFFYSFESAVSSLAFSVPAVKGIEFGTGFAVSKMRGSEVNDQFYTESNKVKTYTNHSGGIQGGITNGMPVVFRVVIRPTSSISKPQKTINMETLEEAEILIKGRHDPCIVPRAVAAVEAAARLAALDLLMEGGFI